MTASRRLLPAIVLVLALSIWVAVAGVSTMSVQASTARTHVAQAWQPIPVDAQDEGEQGAADSAAKSDDRVEVQVWTIAAAGIAMAVGLVGLLVRMVMGWVKPAPPAQEEAQH
ncbi:MAG: hypothetical protein WEE64_06400 [Dehalococcoidia bacterium]